MAKKPKVLIKTAKDWRNEYQDLIDKTNAIEPRIIKRAKEMVIKHPDVPYVTHPSTDDVITVGQYVERYDTNVSSALKIMEKIEERIVSQNKYVQGEFEFGGGETFYRNADTILSITRSKSDDNDSRIEIKHVNKKYNKIPIIIMKWDDGEVKGWRAEIADNYDDYKPATYDDINFEDLGFHYQHNVLTHPDDYLVFLRRKDAVEAANFVNEKYLSGKAKIWFIK